MSESRLLTVRNVADVLRCSTMTVWRLSKKGQIPQPVKVGGMVRWKADSLQEWLSAQCPGNRSTEGGA